MRSTRATRRFARFLEGLVSADLIPDEPAQRAIADVINPHLREAGAELRETGSDGGYPVFSVVPVGAAPSPAAEEPHLRLPGQA